MASSTLTAEAERVESEGGAIGCMHAPPVSSAAADRCSVLSLE